MYQAPKLRRSLKGMEQGQGGERDCDGRQIGKDPHEFRKEA